MTLAPLTTGPHLVRADRLAFTTPVREAGGAGHWVTIHGGDDAEPGGGVHIFISSSGVVEKGPRGLLSHHIGAVASHPSAGKAQHHPVGHEPPGAREHPHYAEAAPKPPVAPGEAGSGEAAKRPGKPYARLSGADQGTRQEQIGKALSEAQGAAKGANATRKAQVTATGTTRFDRDAAVPEKAARYYADRLYTSTHSEPVLELAKKARASLHGFSSDELGHLDRFIDSVERANKLLKQGYPTQAAGLSDVARAQVQHFGVARMLAQVDPQWKASGAQQEPQAAAQQAASRTSAFDNPVSATARMADKAEASLAAGGVAKMADTGAMKEQLRAKVAAARAAKAARQQQSAIADTAVAHQQAQADLAAHRANADRNPNPWAPHLSPPVGDAKDRELAEKATRAQLAHQAAQAQQQGQAQAEQTEGQRAHEKEMVRLKQATGGRGQATEDTPGHTLESVSADVERHKAHVLDEHPDLKAFLGHAEQHNAARPKRFEERIDTQHHEKWLATEARARLSPEQRKTAGIPERMAQRFAKPAIPSPVTPNGEAGPAFTAPQSKEKQQKQEPPTAKTETTLFAQPNYLRDHVATRSEMDLRRDAEGLAGMHQQAIKRQIGMERAGDTTSDAYKANAQHAAMLNKHAAAVNDRLEDSRQKSIAGSESELHGPERRGGGPHDTLVHDQSAAKPAFRAPQSKEKPQTAPQPEQPAGAPVPSPQHREALRDGRRLLAQKALDPEAHKARVDAAVHKATAADAFGGAQVGYASHGSEYAQRLAHLEAASHYQNHADALQRQHLALTNQDTGGALGKAQRHIEALTHHEQRAQGQTHPESDQQARELLARSQAIGRHYTSAVQHLNAKAQEHRDAHARLRRTPPVRESATPTRFSAPAAR